LLISDTDIFVLLKQYLFCLVRQNTTPGAILPSTKHFQTTAERHYSAYFSSGHMNRVPTRYWKYWKSIEFQNWFSRPWKSIEFCQNVH